MADLLIPFAREVATGRMVHAAQVPRGDACGCVCPECGAALTARQGPERTDHFAHKARNPNCTYTPETSLHEGAKQIIADEARVFFPALYARHPNGFPHSTAAESAGWALLHDISQEYRGLPGVVPDVYALQADGTPLAIEIHVTHAAPREKLERLAALKIQTLEIVLSSWRGVGTADYRIPVLQTADRHWLWHPRQAEIDAVLAEEAAKQQRAQAAARETAARLRQEQLERQRALQAQQAEQRAAMGAKAEAALAAELERLRLRRVAALAQVQEAQAAPIVHRYPPSHWAPWAEAPPSYDCAACRESHWWSFAKPDPSMPNQRAWLCRNCHPPSGGI